MSRSFLLFALLYISFTAFAQPIRLSQLPVYDPIKLRFQDDWLISRQTPVSDLYKTKEGYMVMSNGLVSRTFTVSPNGATIALDNLVTHESLVRAVLPEATVWVNGHEIKVGGLTGQPIGNYLLPEWIPEMKADPYALRLTSYNTSPIKARFEWNRRKDWSPQQMPWPPKGLELTFTYEADAAAIQHFQNKRGGDAGRNILLRDDFISLSSEWKVVTANAPANAFNNEGKAGEVLAPANAVVYGEQPLPADTRVIVCKLNTGTDKSTDYGPGVAIAFADGQTAKFYLSPGSKHFSLTYKNKRERFEGLEPGKSYYTRLQLDGNEIQYSISDDGAHYRPLGSVKIESAPLLIRLGKTDVKGGGTAKGESGSLGRSKIEQLLILGESKSDVGDFNFLKGLRVKVHYEIYDGLPLISKWVTVENNGTQEIIVNNIKSEQLAVTEGESAVEHKDRWQLPPIFAESDFAFGSGTSNAAENACLEWLTDSTYTTQVNYALQTPTILSCMPKTGMGQELEPGASFESMRLWELVYDSYDRERRGLSMRKMYRTIAPWATENPIIMHVSRAEDEPVKKAIDQCAEVGFEMVIMTFGSGFNIEDTSQYNLRRMKALKDYARSKGVSLGGYSLLASRSIDAANDVVMPPGMKPAFGNSPCLQSEWGRNYFNKLYHFYETTGQDLLEHDGSYPGDVCASTSHPGHRGLEDSRWKQFREIQDFYRWCRSKGVYLNVPDWYFLNGSNKIAMGYRETNWSLPRELQEIIERQNIYDGTWEKTPSMGWMFVPLVQYHGGGAAATIEPLKEHLPHYEQRLANLFGAGVQACYRGPQLYDATQTKTLVKKWVDFYKKHRQVLDGDIIHIRRPDGRDYDAILHVNPQGEEKGLLMVYNPLNEVIVRDLEIDLYYTGLKNEIRMSEKDGTVSKKKLIGTRLNIQVKLPAKGQSWFVFTQ